MVYGGMQSMLEAQITFQWTRITTRQELESEAAVGLWGRNGRGLREAGRWVLLFTERRQATRMAPTGQAFAHYYGGLQVRTSNCYFHGIILCTLHYLI